MPRASRPVIAVFDFDHTLIRADSLLDFLRHSFSTFTVMGRGWRFLPTFLRYATGNLSNTGAKERLLTLFLAGQTEAEFTQLCTAYAHRLSILARPEAIARLRWHQSQQHHIIIESASIGSWIRPWAKTLGVDEVIATELASQHGVLTGRLATPNCHGRQKVVRLLESHPDRQSYTLYAYGDGRSDRELLALADHPFLRTFEE